MNNTKTKIVYKIKWKNLIKIISFFLIIIFLLLGFYFAYKIIKNYNDTKENITYFKEKIKVEAIVDDEYTRSIPPDKTLSKFDIYWDYIKLGLIDVDMASLKRINTDTKGYLEIKGTDFNYPIVNNQNGFYKNHTFDKKENIYGWPYLTEYADSSEIPLNTVIEVPKVFGSIFTSNLNEVFKSTWNENEDNFIIKYYTNDYTTLWQIISVYKTDNTNLFDNLSGDESELEKNIDEIIKKSEIKFKAKAKATDKFLTIKTVSKKNNTVLFAKLIKIKEER